MTVEVDVHTNKFGYEREPVISTHDNEHLTIKARVCLEMIQRWALVAAEDDGEDSHGRSKLKLSEPDALVNRATILTELAFKRFHEKNWIVKLPSLHEATEKAKIKDDKYRELRKKLDNMETI